MERKETVFPLYRESFEHDSCGIGAVISIRGEQTHRTVDDALKIVEKLQHRAGKDACGETGDGVGLMMQIPHRLMLRAAAEIGIEALGPARSYGVGGAPRRKFPRLAPGSRLPGDPRPDRTECHALHPAVLCPAPGTGAGRT